MTRLSYAQARAAVQRLGISTIAQYRQRYREESGLPSAPPQVYLEWTDWTAFLALKPAKFLPLSEAMQAVGLLSIQDQAEYRQRYREHPGLPSNPEKMYLNWPGWSVYLGKGMVQNARRKRLNVPAAQQRAYALGLTTVQAYRRAAKDDLLLPRDPERLSGWLGWAAFLGNEDPMETWHSYAEARALVQAHGWTDARTYQAQYREYDGLPQNPGGVYVEWAGWAAFLATRPLSFLPYADACRVARAAKIESFRDYAIRYKNYPGLPSTPNKAYAGEWQGWAAFLDT